MYRKKLEVKKKLKKNLRERTTQLEVQNVFNNLLGPCPVDSSFWP
jgi:hypothetical protein